MQIDIDEFYKIVGKNLAIQRKILNLNQEQFGELLGLSRTSIVNIEKGRQRLSLHLLFIVLQKFQIQMSQLMPAIPSIQVDETLNQKIERNIKDKRVTNIIKKLLE